MLLKRRVQSCRMNLPCDSSLVAGPLNAACNVNFSLPRVASGAIMPDRFSRLYSSVQVLIE